MILGVDLSTYFENEQAGAHFYKNGQEIDLLSSFVDNGVNYLRIRLWVDPYSKKHESYLGGSCDLNNFIKLAKLGQEKGFKIVLDLHYSDFWCDPSKQTKPKSWESFTNDELVDEIYKYTKQVLHKCKFEKIDVPYVQIGNEITNGMLWPNGKLIEHGDGERTNYDVLCGFLKSGIKAAKEEYDKIKIIIHLEKSNDYKIYHEYVGNLKKYKVDYDILGASYYPYWHGTFDEFFDNMQKMKSETNKDIMIMETGYAFTLAGYPKELLDKDESSRILIDERFLGQMKNALPYPISEEGQKLFLLELIDRSKKNDIKAIFYWEPAWLPLRGICWASKAGLEYIHEENKTTRNEWANQCLFDYKGNMLSGFNVFKNKKETK